MNKVTITPTDNGPYVIQGGVTLLDGEGNPYQLSDTIALCRCGHSSTKPFCDGSHERVNFAAVNRAQVLAERCLKSLPAASKGLVLFRKPRLSCRSCRRH